LRQQRRNASRCRLLCTPQNAGPNLPQVCALRHALSFPEAPGLSHLPFLCSLQAAAERLLPACRRCARCATRCPSPRWSASCTPRAPFTSKRTRRWVWAATGQGLPPTCPRGTQLNAKGASYSCGAPWPCFRPALLPVQIGARLGHRTTRATWPGPLAQVVMAVLEQAAEAGLELEVGGFVLLRVAASQPARETPLCVLVPERGRTLSWQDRERLLLLCWDPVHPNLYAQHTPSTPPHRTPSPPGPGAACLCSLGPRSSCARAPRGTGRTGSLWPALRARWGGPLDRLVLRVG